MPRLLVPEESDQVDEGARVGRCDLLDLGLPSPSCQFRWLSQEPLPRKHGLCAGGREMATTPLFGGSSGCSSTHVCGREMVTVPLFQRYVRVLREGLRYMDQGSGKIN